MILGSIYCQAGSGTLDAILAMFGLRTVKRDETSHYDIESMTRHSDPVVERDLFDLAVRKLDAAQCDGALPRWTLLEKRKSKYRSSDRR